MTTPLKIALIGAGAMGRQHAGYIAKESAASLVAIADPFSSALADEIGIKHFAGHCEMLDQVRPDAVIIANPNDLHVTTAIDCLERGIPNLLEKPVACSREEASQLIAAQQRHSVPILVGHHRRHNPVAERAKAIIDEGRLGRLATVTGMWQTCKPDDYFSMEWRRRPGAGVILINLVHDLDLLRHLCGEIASVQAMTQNSLRGFEVEDSAVIQLEFANGALGSLTGSDAVVSPWGWDQNVNEVPIFAKHLEQSCYFLAGSEGALSIPQLTLWRYGDTRGWQHQLVCESHRYPQDSAQQRQLAHFLKVARGLAEPLVSVADAARTLAVIDAIQEAARTGQRQVPLTP
ncbi:Gfo/Idh/MocA family protein [Halomonas urumqiensis]|uniref:Gfo/Idh/MocA family oxidoreductase n=1 Tax=Halomonas urumqiensis TaxID=1684789 RepID=A0A2N7UJ39_9GAMM|nr:Gfo/Idh/MocA family oxidoreductase [Halomonas urumqiensis]PMR80452.1 gfo/Idh/MocA family oxidoreductase [Halomonas urumqiensis]PTB01703.1 gfo/Idh/MocA family oxidoreductase [Halomonas urumqiensis]GHE22204.1 oxidoreductase [Halomonas urumqiensis]